MSQSSSVTSVDFGPPLSVAVNGWFWARGATGSSQYLTHLLRALLELPVPDRYTVFTPMGSEGTQPAGLSSYGDRLRIVPLATPLDAVNRNLAKVWFEQVSFPRACRQSGVDLAHVPYWGPPAHAPVPLVTTVHDLIPLLLSAYRSSLLARLYTYLVSQTVRRSALVLTDSRASANDIFSRLRLSEGRVRVIYLAADDAYRRVTDMNRLEEVRGRYRLPATFILYLGGFDRRKNLIRLVRAFAQLVGRERHTPPLVIAGRLPKHSSELFPDVRGEVSRLQLEGQIHFTGWVAEMDKPALYSLATCFVFPSIYEGFGLPVLEAMACATPVVTSQTSSLGEIVGDAGVLVDPYSEDEIARGMDILLSDTSERGRLAAAAQARAGRFNWGEVARTTRAAYRDALSPAAHVLSQGDWGGISAHE